VAGRGIIPPSNLLRRYTCMDLYHTTSDARMKQRDRHRRQESEVAAVASTLAIAATFEPLRGRIQSPVDRGCYRKKYDAEMTLEAYFAKLKNETDLEALNNELVRVVRETMQPSHASSWPRPDIPRNREEADV
jgi:hypothetical protein